MVRRRKRASEASEPPPEEPGAPEPAVEPPVEPPEPAPEPPVELPVELTPSRPPEPPPSRRSPSTPARVPSNPRPPATVAPRPGRSPSDLAGSWRDLLALSQPRAWPTTALPFAVAAYDAGRGLSPALVLGTLYFLGPFHLLIHGVDPSAVPAERARSTRFAIALTNLPLLAVLVLLGGAAAGLALS